MLILVPIAPLPDEGFVGQLLGNDDMRNGGQHGHVGAGAEREMMLRFDMR